MLSDERAVEIAKQSWEEFRRVFKGPAFALPDYDDLPPAGRDGVLAAVRKAIELAGVVNDTRTDTHVGFVSNDKNR